MPRNNTTEKISRFNIYLIKSHINNFDSCIKEEEISEIDVFDLKRSFGISGKFYLKKNRPKPLQWLKMLEPALERGTSLIELFGTFASGVLFVKSKNRIFAYVFGGGRNLLKAGAYVTDFGLKVTLNSVNPSKLRTIDTLSLDDNALQVRRQAVGDSGLEAFGVDIERDYLKAVAGVPDDDSFALRIAGRDSLMVHTRTKLSDLPVLSAEALRRYGLRKYREHFEWIDDLSPVRDVELIGELNQKICEKLNEKQQDHIFFAYPEIVAPEQQLIFQYSTQRRSDRREFADLYIEDFLSTLEENAAISISDLKTFKVWHKDQQVQSYENYWRLWDCLTCQVKQSGDTYILSMGQWHKAKATLVTQLKNFLGSRYQATHCLPKSRENEKEESYNRRAARGSGIVLFDRKTTTIPGASTPIEVCDLFTTGKELFHIKRKSKSATLSHLFAQGLVSGVALVDIEAFRNHARTILNNAGKNKNLISKSNFKTSNYTIIYGVIGRKRGDIENQIPFFSQLNFRQTARNLERIGYIVKLCRIDLE